MRIDIPGDAAAIIETFEKNGYEAYVVGGCVRDCVIGRTPEDWDITTSATPEQIKALFKKTIDTGIQHGTVTIRMGGCSYETTTFRIDGEYEDSRHPSSVEFTSLLSEDLKRRDFTINAMAYSPRTGIIDMFGGIDDLKRGIIRCVGNPHERFSEDALRTLRAVRFAGQLGFCIEEDTLEAISDTAPDIKNISAERIRMEITKLIMSEGPDRMMAAKNAGLTKFFLPEWDEIAGDENRAERIIRTIKEVNGLCVHKDDRDHKILCFAALLAETPHPKEIMVRMKFDNYSIGFVDRLTRYCGFDFDMTMTEFRKFLSVAGTDIMELLYILREAYHRGYGGEYAEYMRSVDESSKRMFKKIMEKGDALTIRQLDITGNDLYAAGIPKGKVMGDILGALLDCVLEQPSCNNKKWLLSKAMTFLKNF